MKTMGFKGVSLEELAISVSDHLTRNGIEAVLTGGACVSIYTKNKYLSLDLDFVLISSEKKPTLRATMEAIGFRLESGHFRHKDTPFFIEFLPPPPSLGEEPLKEISILGKRGRRLKLLSPTDCIKDRLAAFYHWNDRQSLEQALLVCRAKRFDLDEIRRWSEKENMAEKFEIFRSRLKAKRTP
ncbi:MAG: hypothetical protein NTW38_05215 [Candidatus Aminicenantes bacterium]|nr:hypothetical protein [Candidatus Aminicenantes bacterium]